MPDVHPSTMVKVRNVGPKPFRKQYANQWYVLQPGRDSFVPYHAMVMWMGDPESSNIGTRDSEQYRTKEIRRLSCYYGTQGDPWFAEPGENLTTTTAGEKDRNGEWVQATPFVEGRHPMLPFLEAYNLDDNSRITTVLDDPEGQAVTPPSNTMLSQRDLEAQVRHNADVQKVLMEELTKLNPDAAARLAALTPATDTPTPAIVFADPNPDVGTTFDTEADDALTDPEVQELPAVEDVPPSARPRSKAGARAAAEAQS